MSDPYLPTCYSCGKGELKKHQPFVNTKIYVCKKCGTFHRLKRRTGSGYTYI